MKLIPFCGVKIYTKNNGKKSTNAKRYTETWRRKTVTNMHDAAIDSVCAAVPRIECCYQPSIELFKARHSIYCSPHQVRNQRKKSILRVDIVQSEGLVCCARYDNFANMPRWTDVRYSLETLISIDSETEQFFGHSDSFFCVKAVGALCTVVYSISYSWALKPLLHKKMSLSA